LHRHIYRVTQKNTKYTVDKMATEIWREKTQQTKYKPKKY